MLSGQKLVRSAGRAAQRASRPLLPTSRGVATKTVAGPSRSSAWSSYSIAAITALGVGVAAYALQPRFSAIRCEPRQAWSDRLKPKESKGGAFLHKDAHDRHAPAAAHDEHVEAAEENPVAIEVAVEESEEQTGQQSAYDPETGEINWDCACLGGMAHGPCDKFKAMQDCFREHPDVYKDEIEDDEAANAQFEKEEAEAKTEEAKTEEAKTEDKKEVSAKKEEQKESSA